MFARRVTAEDLPVILAMARRFHAESPVHRDLAFAEEKVEQLVLHATMDDDWLALIVFDAEDKPAGMALCYAVPEFFSYEKVAGELTIFVDADRRGTRAARAMVDCILTWAKQRECRSFTIALNTGIDPQRSTRFFQMLGFSLTGSVLRFAL